MPESPAAKAEATAIDLAAVADWKKADDPVLLDLRGLSTIADFFLVASSISPIGVRAVAEGILQRLKKVHGAKLRSLHVEGMDAQEWVCIDAGDIVVHIFLESVRGHFDLEGLWADAPRVEVPESALKRVASSGEQAAKTT